MTNSQFADKCGIPRPTLSQLLSGRNKKLSDQVLRPIHDQFPNLSIVWLMFGEGDMLVGNDAESNEAYDGNVSAIPNDLDSDGLMDTSGFADAADRELCSTPDGMQATDSKHGYADDNATDRESGKMSDVSVSNEGYSTVYRRSPSQNRRQENGYPRPTPRKVRSIVVYYDDNTYETFFPGQIDITIP